MRDAAHPRGATKMPTRDELESRNRPYVYQAYPSVRYHRDGRSITVNDEAEDIALGKEWTKTHAEPAVIAENATTVHELQQEIVRLKADAANKVKMFDHSWAALTKEHAELKAHCEELEAKLADYRDGASPPEEKAPEATADPTSEPFISKSEAKRHRK